MNFNIRQGFANLQDTVLDLQANISQNISPLALRTKQQLQEKLLGDENATTLPQDYISLETQFEEVIAANNDLLRLLSIFESEGYDYPPSFREVLGSTYRGLHDRVFALRQAVSPQEAGQILLNGSQQNQPEPPRTLHFAISRALTSLGDTLTNFNKEHLSPIFKTAGEGESVIAQAQQDQDRNVCEVTAQLRELNAETERLVSQARRDVSNTRLDLDVKKGNLRNAPPNSPKLGSLESEVERAEEDFVAAIEQATTLMTRSLQNNSKQAVKCLLQLLRAQREYHRRAAENLSTLIPDIEKLESSIDYSDIRIHPYPSSANSNASNAGTSPNPDETKVDGNLKK